MQYEVLHRKCSTPKSQALTFFDLLFHVIAVGMYILVLSCIEPVLHFMYDYPSIRYMLSERDIGKTF